MLTSEGQSSLFPFLPFGGSPVLILVVRARKRRLWVQKGYQSWPSFLSLLITQAALDKHFTATFNEFQIPNKYCLSSELKQRRNSGSVFSLTTAPQSL